MIPTIEQIVDDIWNEAISKKKAITLLHQHVHQHVADAHRDLRDEFAGQALNGLMASGYPNAAASDALPGIAYEIADKMIEAREKHQARNTKPPMRGV